MQIRIFGKELFSYRAGNDRPQFIGEGRASSALERIKDDPFLPDFHRNREFSLDDNTIYAMTTNEIVSTAKKIEASKKTKEEKLQLTPKGVYELEMLNEKAFKIKMEPKYIDDQVKDFKRRLGMLSKARSDMSNGAIEIASILMRLENRRKYGQYKTYFDQFPYTLTSKIEQVLKEHNHLKLGQVEEFVPDLPTEAVDVMTEYSQKVKQLCLKKAVFYIIAKKTDFKQKSHRRDPILLAQSPFGHFWQILGAWDEEMLFLEEL